MPRVNWYRIGADALVVFHLAAYAGLLAGALLPWAVHFALIAATVYGLAFYEWRCLITRKEVILRARAYPDREIRGEGMTRRLIRWAFEVDPGETWATAITGAGLVAGLVVRAVTVGFPW